MKFLILFFLSLTIHATSKESPTDTAITAFNKYGKTVTTLSTECVSFSEDGPVKGESDMDITVSEKHGGKCGGDPATSPAVAHLRVKGKKVFILDPVSDEYKTFNAKYKPEY